MRVLWEEDHVPVVVAHGRRAIAAVRVQKSNKQLAVVPDVFVERRRKTIVYESRGLSNGGYARGSVMRKARLSQRNVMA